MILGGMTVGAIALLVNNYVYAQTPSPPLTLGSPPLDRDKAKALKNPLGDSPEAIHAGQRIFQQYCTMCHGADGKAQVQLVAQARDLTDPDGFQNGISDGELFRTIRDGTGQMMPPFRGQLKAEDQVWSLVSYVKSLWPAK
jgi:mono/diheme cytochrome c family protein